MKITNYEIYKLKKSGLTNQQILKVLEYGENVDQELCWVILQISQVAVIQPFYGTLFSDRRCAFVERVSKFPSFSILDDCYPWDLSEIYDAPVLFILQGKS